MTKICVVCKVEKIYDEFDVDRSTKTGHHPRCKSCRRAYCRKRRAIDPEWKKRQAESVKKWRKSEAGKAWFKENSPRLVRTLNWRFRCSRAQAKGKGRTWTLTKDQYASLISKPCFYCGGPQPESGYGLDRKNNSLGYEIDNVVSCCSPCNYARNDHFTVDEMTRIIGPAIRKVREERENKSLLEKHPASCKCLDGRYCALSWGGLLLSRNTNEVRQ